MTIVSTSRVTRDGDKSKKTDKQKPFDLSKKNLSPEQISSLESLQLKLAQLESDLASANDALRKILSS